MRLRRSRLLLFAIVIALTAVLGGRAAARILSPGAQARIHQRQAREAADRRELRMVMRRIVAMRNEVWRWQRVMSAPRFLYGNSAARSSSDPYQHWVLRLWTRRADHVRSRARRPPHLAQWICIHRYEGAWNDPNAPYYGGLQMDLGFQRRYGRRLLAHKGTADNWTPLEQMWVAERAHRSGRGFWPWPNTARLCGLL